MEVGLLPQKDLRALFSTNLVDLDAVHVFANRNDERQAFDDGFLAHRRFVREEQPDPHDLLAPRRNILVYYGVGGVGKTTLSKQLQSRVHGGNGDQTPPHWPPFPDDVGRVLAVRLDLSREAGLDVESLVLLVRAALAPLGRPMVAFDLALARYWERAHRENIGEYLRRHGIFEQMPQARRVPDYLAEAVGEVGGLTGMAGLGLLVQTGPALVGYLRDKSRQRHAIKDCLRLPDLLEADATVESLSYYPHLLAWDLAQIQRRRDVSLVVFVDTFEEIGTRTNRELERILQRMVWLMPNTFFVVTGRNRLEWDDPTLGDRLDWAGPVNWPGLASAPETVATSGPAGTSGPVVTPRQHLIGYLSSSDADHYLKRRLSRRGQPAIPEEIRARIVRNSHGLPLYLDLSVMRFLQVIRAGREPRPEEFDHTFPGVVARMFRDLDEPERAVLRAVSLLDSFDVDLAAVTAGVRTDAPVLQLVQRAFVQYDPSAPWPYHIHNLVCEHVRGADVGLADSWSAHDWRHAAERAVAHLGDIARGSRERHDRRTLIAALNQGFRLAHDFDLPLGWLTDGAYWFIEDSVWEPTLRPPVEDLELAGGPPRTRAHTLAAGLVAITQRQRVHRGHTLALLERCLDSGLLAGQDADAVELLAYYRAECQRDLGHPDDSERGMRAVIDGGGRMADMALRGLSHVQRRRGRFRQLYDHLAGRAAEGVWHRVRGDLWWTQGRLAEAVDEYDAAVDWASRERLAGEVATSAACRAWAAALHSSRAGAEAVAFAREALTAVTITWSDLQAGCAEAILAAGDETEVDRRCTELTARATTHGLTSSAAYAAFARAFHHAVLADRPGLLRAREAVRALVRGDEFAYLCEIVDHWLADLPDAPARQDGVSSADWVDGVEPTAARWREIVRRRRRERPGVR